MLMRRFLSAQQHASQGSTQPSSWGIGHSPCMVEGNEHQEATTLYLSTKAQGGSVGCCGVTEGGWVHGAGGLPSNFQLPTLDGAPVPVTSPQSYVLPCTNCSFTQFVTFSGTFTADAPSENLVFTSMQRVNAFYLADVEIFAT